MRLSLLLALPFSLAALHIPPTAKVLSRSPLIFTVPELLSPSDCDDLIKFASGDDDRLQTSNAPQASLKFAKLSPLLLISPLFALPTYIHTSSVSQSLPIAALAFLTSTILAFTTVQTLNATRSNNLRTSLSLALNSIEDQKPATLNLVRSVEQILDIPRSRFEAPVITKYPPGALFAPHNDASPTLGSEWSELGGQRVATAIVGLKTISSGRTNFPKLSLEVPIIRGQALFFFPADADSLEADERTIHEGSLVEDEEKYISQIFVRADVVPPPLGMPKNIYQT